MCSSGTRWIIGTVVVLVLAGLGVPAGIQLYRWNEAAREAREKQAALDASQAELARLQAERDAARQQARTGLDAATTTGQRLAQDYQAALSKARKEIEDKDFVVRLTGPARIEPGAPNTWQIETLNARGEAVRPKKLEIAVKDASNVTLHRETHDTPTGQATLVLTTAFWEKVKPGTELYLEVLALTDDDRKGVLEERIPLSRPVFVTHLATDKPLYKPGETVRFRSLTLDRSTLRPPANDQFLKFRLRDPSDSVIPLDEGNGRVLMNLQPVLGPDKKPVRGIGVGEHVLGSDVPGGEYKLDLFEMNPETGTEALLETRKFLVNRYNPDTFEKKLEFDGKSYGPGDVVQARVEVSRTAGGPMKDAKANVVAGIDGRVIHQQTGEKFTLVTSGGTTKAVLNVRFTLPKDLFVRSGTPNATLSVNIQDGSDAEPIVRPIPLVTKNLNIEFFPEGGWMVAGVPGRVFFQVRTPAGKPADLKGYITDGANRLTDAVTLTDAENEGVNRGHGVFELSPKAGTRYFLKIVSPLGIAEPSPNGFPLPEVKADGVVLTALDAVTAKGAPIRVRLQTAHGPKTLHVGAYARGRLIAHHKLVVEAGKPVEVALKGDDTAGGVTRVTVFEEPKADGPGRAKLIPRAERLVYRQPAEQLILNANPDQSRYTPGGKVRLELSAFNEKEKPTAAVLLVGVVNRSVITMADNKTDRLMPTHFLLSGDIKHPAELEHADFLLTDHPKAGVALDLLLATQGWRRFAEQGGAAAEADKADVDRMLVAHGRRTSAPLELYRLEQQRVNSEFRPQVEAATLQLAIAEAGWAEFEKGNAGEFGAKVAAAQTSVTAAEKQHQDAAAALYRHETRGAEPRSWALPGLVVGLLGLSIGGLALAVTRPGSRLPYLGGTLGCLVLGGLTVAAVIETRGTDAAQRAWNERERDRNPQLAKADAAKGVHAGERAVREEAMARLNERAAVAQGMPGLGMPRDDAGGPMPAAMPAGPVPPPGAIAPRMDPVAKKPAPAANGDFAGKGDGRRLAAAKPDLARGARGKQDREQAMIVDALRKKRAIPDGRLVQGRPGLAAGGLAGPVPPGLPPGAGGFGGPAGIAPGMPAVVPFVVREYAHQRDPSLGEARADFTETVYWHPVLVLPESGKATVEFQLSDDIARYQVLVAGHTTDGRIGAITKTIEARKPFSVDPKLPLEISHTDTVDVPVRVTNDSNASRSVTFAATPNGFTIEGAPQGAIDLGPNGKGRQVLRLKAGKLQGDASLTIDANSPGAQRDMIARTIRVVPDGFPVVGSVSDMMEGRARGTVTLPKDIVPGSLKVRLEVYPTSLADLVKGLDGLLQEPGGCFEQTSTTNYPNTLILDYMNQTNQANPEVTRRAKGYLDRGYARLTSYECPDTPGRVKHGFEWFGAADLQHEALTAYGLMQFKDMARVHPVDPELIRRTQGFLLARKDGQGGFRQNPRALHTWGASKQVVNAYIVWALIESDPEDTEKLDLAKEIAALKTEAADETSANGKDAYFVALVANILLHRGDRQAAHQLLDRLKDKHLKNGVVTGAVTSVTCSGGRDLQIETTALALLGWLRANDPKYTATIKDATKWISQQRGGYGGFGSTQSTILALKALIVFAKKSAHPAEDGVITLSAGGKVIGTRKFTKADIEVIGLDVENPETVFKAGATTEVEIVTDAKQAYPFALSYTYTTLTPVSGEKCAVRIGTKLARAEAAEGDTVPLSVSLENRQKKNQGMTVAVVGIPAGLKVPTDLKQLTQLREDKVISFFEVRGRELVLYWRELAPEQKITLTVDLVCDVPGTYRGPASRGYLYYDADHKHWVEPLGITIAPLKNEVK